MYVHVLRLSFKGLTKKIHSRYFWPGLYSVDGSLSVHVTSSIPSYLSSHNGFKCLSHLLFQICIFCRRFAIWIRTKLVLESYWSLWKCSSLKCFKQRWWTVYLGQLRHIKAVQTSGLQHDIKGRWSWNILIARLTSLRASVTCPSPH